MRRSRLVQYYNTGSFSIHNSPPALLKRKRRFFSNGLGVKKAAEKHLTLFGLPNLSRSYDSLVKGNGVKTSWQISQHKGPQLDHSLLPGSVQDQSRPQPPYELQASLGRPAKILDKDIRRPAGLHRFFNILG